MVQGTYGAINKDEYYKQLGLNNLQDSADRTIKGVRSALNYTVDNAGSTYKGFVSGDTEQAVNGLKNLGKVAAVSGLAIGVIDVIDGADIVEAEELETRNDHLNGYEHPVTGVPFIEKTVELSDGQVIEGTFPVFDSAFETEIPEDLYLESDDVHADIANCALYQHIIEQPSFADDLGLSKADLQALENGETPEGYTWHHHEEPGRLQLVDEETHAKTAHTGGRAIWGGGSEYR